MDQFLRAMICGKPRIAKADLTLVAAYRLAQKALVDRGDTAGAFWMDIQDIQSKFGSKYDEAIMQALRSLGR